MPDPFESSRRRLARAKDHILDLDRKIIAFVEGKPYAAVTETHPETPDHLLYKVKLVTPLDPSFSDVAADAMENMRSSLDHAAYAVANAFAAASGRTSPTVAYFPFAGSAADFENAIKGRAISIFPQEIIALFRGFEPYRGGNDLLWALNKIRNSGFHKILTPTAVNVGLHAVKAHALGFMSIETEPVWDSSNNEVILAETGPGTEFDYELDFSIRIVFSGVESAGGESALTILCAMVGEVERVIMALEAESRRIGIIS